MNGYEAGWYQVPNSTSERFFDGYQWTEHYRNPQQLQPFNQPSPHSLQSAPSPQGVSHPGWYADPWNPRTMRWWDGYAWQHQTAPAPKRELPPQRRPWRRFLVPWVAVGLGAPLIGFILLFGLFTSPLVFVLALVPSAMLGAALWWMDRLEPEPLDALLLSVAWGAVVAPLFALIGGIPFAVLGDAFSAVVGAPFTEEIGKGAILLILLHRRVIDSIIDGAMYAVAVAAGFAIIEDIIYFTEASSLSGEDLLFTFIVRGILTPFAHPLFTIWMGFAAGWIVVRRPSTPVALLAGAGSLGLAMGLHALWNGTLVLTGATENMLILIAVALLFVLLFVATIVVVVLLRRQQTRDFEQQVPELAALTGLTPAETAVFADTKAYLRQRKTLPSRKRKLLGQLRWNLHALGSLRRVPPKTNAQATGDAIELEHLRDTIHSLRQQLMNT